jgi:hypothetical protein
MFCTSKLMSNLAQNYHVQKFFSKEYGMQMSLG